MCLFSRYMDFIYRVYSDECNFEVFKNYAGIMVMCDRRTFVIIKSLKERF